MNCYVHTRFVQLIKPYVVNAGFQYAISLNNNMLVLYVTFYPTNITLHYHISIRTRLLVNISNKIKSTHLLSEPPKNVHLLPCIGRIADKITWSQYGVTEQRFFSLEHSLRIPRPEP